PGLPVSRIDSLSAVDCRPHTSHTKLARSGEGRPANVPRDCNAVQSPFPPRAFPGMTTEHAAYSLFRHRPVFLLWLARVATSIAYQMQVVAVGWQIYVMTSSPMQLG